ncbi:MAG TPA: NAD(P)-binding domain-containing protein [Acidimicrobiia bacterium]|nr:pyridine nucleotide-disulfide oxidoreductase [Acidimicrobiia bacterium]HYJ23461.1 NAD(P)-binding domain-containing protein [Acidimicrobiia bacterium]
MIGAGHAGLAVSHFLSQRSIDHIVVERGEVANTWRTERWDSLRLLTPNWQSRLPGLEYDGDDPDGYMTMPEVIGFIDSYAKATTAPLRTHTTVKSLRPNHDGYEVVTDDGTWSAPTVVLATGGFNLADIPAIADDVPGSLETVTPLQYRAPERLPDGGVLVVGASATGIQIAEEVHASGRPVTLSVGEHVRLPRVYRGKDIMWWLDRTGVLDERWDEVDDLVRARNIPSPQLVGTPERRTLDLNALTDQGVRLVGRVAGIVDGKAQLSGSLRNLCNLADLKMDRLLGTIDDWVTENGMEGEVDAPHRFIPTRVEESPPISLDLADGAISTVIWATGFRPDYSWLHARVLDRKGRLRHDAGVVTGAPGLYRIGLTMLRRRKSSFIHGAEDDARDLIDHLAAYVGVGAPV